MSLNREEKLAKARELLGFDFPKDDRLWEALSSAGAPGAKPEGNQRLASIGTAAIQLVLQLDSYLNGESTAESSDRLASLASVTALHRAFDKSGIEQCINQNPSATMMSPKTAVAVVKAIVGLTSLEVDGRIQDVRVVMQKLGILEQGVIVKDEATE